MLDGLWEWVSGAETTMAITETSSVWNDLETVEAQLVHCTRHYAFTDKLMCCVHIIHNCSMKSGMRTDI